MSEFTSQKNGALTREMQVTTGTRRRLRLAWAGSALIVAGDVALIWESQYWLGGGLQVFALWFMVALLWNGVVALVGCRLSLRTYDNEAMGADEAAEHIRKVRASLLKAVSERQAETRSDMTPIPVEVVDRMDVEGRGMILVVARQEPPIAKGQHVLATGQVWEVREVETTNPPGRYVGLVVRRQAETLNV